MIEEGLLLPMNVLLQGQKLTLLDPEMWFLRGNENKWICPYISRHLLSLNPLLACCRRYSRGER